MNAKHEEQKQLQTAERTAVVWPQNPGDKVTL